MMKKLASLLVVFGVAGSTLATSGCYVRSTTRGGYHHHHARNNPPPPPPRRSTTTVVIRP